MLATGARPLAWRTSTMPGAASTVAVRRAISAPLSAMITTLVMALLAHVLRDVEVGLEGRQQARQGAALVLRHVPERGRGVPEASRSAWYARNGRRAHRSSLVLSVPGAP